MRALYAVLALAACGKAKHEAVDWNACASALRAKAPWPKLLEACPVCNFQPMLDWDKTRAEGGPSVDAVSAAMVGCNAFCNGAAKDRFVGTIEQSRGLTRGPWRYLGDMCKEQVGATPAAMRFMSPPWFALDRMARAVGAHGGDAAAALAGLDIALPPFTVTGVGPQLQSGPVAAPLAPGQIAVTLLGDQTFVGKIPHAKLDAQGIHVVEDGEPYPGRASTDVMADLHALGVTEQTPVAVIATGAHPFSPPSAGMWQTVVSRGELPGGWPDLGVMRP